MAKILYEVKQNQNSFSAAFGKWYAQIKNLETLNTRKLANHISEHGSIYTPDVVYGVLEKFRSCLLEMLLNSKKVKIEGLGTFYCTLENQKNGALKKEDFNVNKHLKALHIRFLPEQTTEENISSRQFLKQAEFINIDSLLPKDTEGNTSPNPSEGGESDNTGSGENTGGNGSNTNDPNGTNSGTSGSGTTSGYALSISRLGSGSASVTHNGSNVNSGAKLNEDDEVELSITPAEGQTPTATINGSSIELTEDNGVYTGSFAMPGQASNLVINTGEGSGGDDYDPNNPIDSGN
jgi:predicted histone-like DNA-binding protein